jgi:hypothetical protein
MAMLFGGLIVAGWFPPPSPRDGALKVAHMYATHADRIRVAALMIACAGALTAPFVSAISAQMKRIEGERGTLSNIQLGTGMLGVLLFTIPTFFWQAAAFTPGRSPQITLALHVAGWLPFIAAIFPAIVQNVSIAAAAFSDRQAEPIFPRWVGYLNIWVATLFLPSGLVLFFHHGPFAWNGIFTFWLAATVFGLWFVVMVMTLLRAITRQATEPGTAMPATAVPAGEALPA